MKNLTNKSGISEELLAQIIEVLKESGVTKAILFGSRARGDFSDASDIDIAFWSKADNPKLWLAMETLPTIHKIDLVDFNAVSNDAFRKNILRDGVVIFEV